MVKFLIIASLCILGASLSKAEFSKTEAIKMFMETAEACRTEAGAAPSDIDDMIKKVPAAGKEGNCMRACVMKKFKVMDDNNKFVKSVALEHADNWTGGDAEKMKVASEIAGICETISISGDACEAAEQYGKCFHDEAKARGIDKLEF